MLRYFQKKNFGEVLDLYQLPHERNFEYLEKNGIMKFLERVFRPGNFGGSWIEGGPVTLNDFRPGEAELCILYLTQCAEEFR